MANQFEELGEQVAQYESEGQHELAVQLCKKAVQYLKLVAPGKENTDVAWATNFFAKVYHNQISHNEREFGQNHKRVAETLENLGDLHYELRKFMDAESAYNRALVISQKIYEKNNPELSNLLLKLGYACKHQEKYFFAELYMKHSLVICKMGELEEAKRKMDLANLYVQMDEFKEAEEIYEDALKVFNRELNPSDLLIGHLKCNLGYSSAKQQRFPEAQKHYGEASIIYKSLGEELHLGDAHLGLGICFFNQGQYEEAKEYYQSAFVLLCEDQKDLKIADAHFNLGICFSVLNQPLEAEPAYLKAVNIYGETLEGNDLRLAEPMFNLANCLMARGLLKEAEEYFLKVLAIHKKNPQIGKLKEEDTNYLFGLCLMKQGRYQEALKRCKVAWGRTPEDLKFATTKIDLANGLLNSGDYQEAMECNEDALRMFDKERKGNELMVADITYNLALCLTRLNRMEEAERHYLDALTIYKEELEPNDIHLGDVNIIVANCYYVKKLWKEAQNYYITALEIYKKNPGEDDLDLVDTYNQFAVCLFKQEFYYKAKNYFLMVLNTTDENLKAETNFNVGLCLFRLDQYEEAEQYFRAALPDSEGFEEDHEAMIAKIKYYIAYCLYRQHNWAEAVNYLKEALIIYEKQPISGDSADTTNLLGHSLYKLFKFKESEQRYREYINLCELLPGDMSVQIAGAYHNLGNCFSKKRKFEDAERFYKESYKMYKAAPGNMDRNLSDVMSNWRHCLRFQGKIAQANVLEKTIDNQ